MVNNVGYRDHTASLFAESRILNACDPCVYIISKFKYKYKKGLPLNLFNDFFILRSSIDNNTQ